MRFLTIVLLLFSTLAFAQEETTTEDIIKTESVVTTNSNTSTRLKSPPASAITPTINTSNSDLCTFGVAGAVQTQILGISTGTQITDENCERLKNAKTLYDMGMKVAAVSMMCQDKRVFEAMMNAGTPCPYDGLIGEEAKAGWELAAIAEEQEDDGMSDGTKTAIGGGGLAVLLLALLL